MELVEQGRELSYRLFLAMAHGLGLSVSCPLDAQASKWAPVIRQTLSSMGDSMARARRASAAPSYSSSTAVASSHQLNIAISFSMPRCIARISVFYLKNSLLGFWNSDLYNAEELDHGARPSLNTSPLRSLRLSLCILTCPGAFLPAPNTNKKISYRGDSARRRSFRRSRSFKVTDFDTNGKPVYDLLVLLANNTNLILSRMVLQLAYHVVSVKLSLLTRVSLSNGLFLGNFSL